MKRFVLIIMACVFAAAIIAFWLALSSPKKLTQEELNILTPDWTSATQGNWSPWYTLPNGSQEWNPAASFNAWIESIHEHDKAWPTLSQALLDLEDLKSHGYLGSPPHVAPDWFELFYLCYHNQNTITELAGAMHAPYIGAPIRPGTDPFTHQLLVERDIPDPDWEPNPPENVDLWVNPVETTGAFRKATQILSTAAYSSLETTRNTDRFLLLTESLFAGAQLSLNRATHIDYLSYYAIYDKPLRVIEWALIYHPEQLDDQDLIQLDWMIEVYPFKPFNPAGEILVIHDRFRRLQPKLGNIDADQVSDILKSWIPNEYHPPSNEPITSIDPRLQHIIIYHTRQYNKVARKSSLPWDGQGLSINEFKEGLDRVSSGLQSVAMENGYAMWQWELNLDYQVKANALRLAIAAERHKRRHGKHPSTIDELDKDLIHFDITDPFTNEPFLYDLSIIGPVIYSAGTDRDNDGARPMRDYYTNPNYESSRNIWSKPDGSIHSFPHWISKQQAEDIQDQSKIDGDWILYPEPDYMSENES